MSENCVNCGNPISDKVAKYSRDKLGKPLCFDCQRGGKEQTGLNNPERQEIVPFSRFLKQVDKNLRGVKTRIVESDENGVVVKASIVFMKEKERVPIEMHGEAYVTEDIKKNSLARIAETRALKRCFKIATGRWNYEEDEEETVNINELGSEKIGGKSRKKDS